MVRHANIGLRLRLFRQERGLTLQQLADGVGLSVSYLSQVENGKASPSIATLVRIAEGLGVRTVDFFADELVEEPPVMLRSQWTRLTIPGWEAELSQLVHLAGDKRMQPFHTVVPPGGGTFRDYSHPGEEFGFILEGSLTLYLGDEVHELPSNAAVYFSSLIPHHWENHGEKPCRLIWVLTPPSW